MKLKFLFKFFVLGLVFVFLLSSFSACRFKTTSEPKKSFEGIELTYYKMFDDADVIEPIIAEYVADKPGLKIKYKKFIDFKEYVELLLNEMAEGRGPDIFSMQNTWFLANYKKLTPMPALFGSSADFERTFVSVAADDLIITDDSGVPRVFALPMTVDTLALYYNKSHFEDRLPAQGRPSSTWDGLVEDVVKLTKTDSSYSRFEVSGLALGRADNISRAADIFYLFLLQNGISFYDNLVSKAIFAENQPNVEQNAITDILRFITSFSDPSQRNYSWNSLLVEENSEEKELLAFARGDVSMMINFAYAYEDIVRQINALSLRGVKPIDVGDIRVVMIPQIFDPNVSKDKRVTYASYFAETVSRNSDYPDIAWDFLIFLTAKKNLQTYFDSIHKPTSRRDMIEGQSKHPIYGVFAAQIGFAESFPVIDYHLYKDIFSDLINSVSEGKDPLETARAAQKAVSALLPSRGLVVPVVPQVDGAN